MATERLAPDAVVASTGYTSAVLANIQDDPDSPDGNWWTTSSNTATTCHVSFPTPTGILNSGANLQNFRILLRKTNQSTNPTFTVDLISDGGTVISTLASSVALSSTSGTVFAYTWDAASLASAGVAPANTAIRITGTPGGGSPGNRASVEVGAVEWNTDYTSAQLGAAALSASGTLVVAGVIVISGASGLSATSDQVASGLASAMAVAASSADSSLAATAEITAMTGATLGVAGDLVADLLLLASAGSALVSDGTMTASAVLVFDGGASLSAETDLVATTTSTLSGDAALDAIGSLAAASIVETAGGAALVATGDLAGTGALLFDGAAALSVASTLSATAAFLVTGAAALSAVVGSGSGTAFTGGYALAPYAGAPYAGGAGAASEGGVGALVFTVAAANLSGSGTLVASGDITVQAGATLSASSDLSVTAEVTSIGAASLSGNANLTSDGTAIRTSGAALSASTELVVTTAEAGEALLSGSGTLVVSAVVIVAGAADLSAQTTLVLSLDGATLTAQSSLTASGLLEALAAASLDANATLATTAIVLTGGAASLSASSSLLAAGTVVVLGAAALSAETDLVVNLTPSANLSGEASLTVTAVVITFAGATLSASATLVGAGVLFFEGAAGLSAQSNLTASGIGVVGGLGLAFLSASTSLTAAAEVPLKAGTAALAGGSQATAVGLLEVSGAVALTSQSNLVAAGAPTRSGDSSQSGSGSLSATANLARYPAAVALDQPVWWFDLADSGATGLSKGSRLFSGFSPITGTYINGARTASILPCDVTGSFDTNTTGRLDSFIDQMSGSPLTFEIWWKPQVMPTGVQRIVMLGGNFFIGVGNTGKPKGRLQFRVVSGSSTDIETVAVDDLVDDGLYHIVATYHNATGAMQLYVNTKLVATGTGGLNAFSDFQSMRIGSFSSNSLDGPAQQAAVYRSVLSPDRITAHYAAGTGDWIVRPALSTRADLVVDGYSFTEGDVLGAAALSAQSDLSATGTSLAVWVPQTLSGQANFVAVGSVIPGATPDNDLLENAIELEGVSGEYSFATRGATSERGATYENPDVFFTWTAPFTGPVQFRLFPRDWWFNAEMEVYLGYPPNTTNFNNFDPDVIDPSPWEDYQVWGDDGEVWWPAIEGQTYTIVVVDYENGGFPDDFAPTQTEAKLVWQMEEVPISTPVGFGEADFLVSWNYTDDTGATANSGLVLQIVRRSNDTFSLLGSPLRITKDEAAPGSPTDSGSIEANGAIHPIGDSKALVVLDSLWGFPFNNHYSYSACVVDWDGVNLTRGPITIITDSIPEASLGVGQWDPTPFHKGAVTGDGQFFLLAEEFSLENGKTYATHKHRMSSWFINVDGTLTATGKSVNYVLGYDFSNPSDDLLAPALWADPELPWFPSGAFVDGRYQALGPREVAEMAFSRDHYVGPAIEAVARLSVADDGTITRHGSHYQRELDGDFPFFVAMHDLIPGTRKMAMLGGFFGESSEPGDSAVLVVDLDTMTAGPITRFPGEVLAGYVERNGNDPFYSRVGLVGGGYVIGYLKERAGSSYQVEVVLQRVQLNGNQFDLVGEARVLRTIAWSDETGSSTDEGTLIAVANGTVVFAAAEGAGANESFGLQGQAVTWSEGEGYQVIIPTDPFDGTNTQAVYAPADIVPFSAAPVPNLAGLLTGQRRVFGRGKAGV